MANGSSKSTKKRVKSKQIVFSGFVFIILFGAVYFWKVSVNDANLEDNHLLSTLIEKNYQGNASMVEAKMIETAPTSLTLKELTKNAIQLQKANQKTIIYKAVSLTPFAYLEDNESALEEIAIIATGKETLLKITKSYHIEEEQIAHLFSVDPLTKNQLNLDDGTLTLNLELSNHPVGKELVKWCRGYVEAFERQNQNASIKRLILEIDNDDRRFRFFSENPSILIEYQSIKKN